MIGFDLEAINLVYYGPENPNEVLQYVSRQLPLSFSVMSNLDNEMHFQWSKEPRKLVSNLFNCFDAIQEKSYQHMMTVVGI